MRLMLIYMSVWTRAGHVWRQAIDTAESAPLDAMNGPLEFPTLHEQNHYHIQAKAVIALLSEKVMI